MKECLRRTKIVNHAPAASDTGFISMSKHAQKVLTVADVIGKYELKAVALIIGLRRREPRAIIEAASRFLTGNGVEQDVGMARRLLDEGVERNIPEAKCILAMLILDHRAEIELSPPTRVFRLLSQAAKDGLRPAQLQLASLVLNGR